MAIRTKRTITTSLTQDELAEFDRACERYNLTRSQALREAIRQYLAAGTRRISIVDPEPGELDAISRGEAAIARGEYVTVKQLLRDLDADHRERSGKKSKAIS
jgi:metal-responsive CopG/Arc/MetJ family transcriptional regulator